VDWNRAIEENRAALMRILALLVSMTGLAGPAQAFAFLRNEAASYEPHSIGRLRHTNILRLLRPMEVAVRRLVIIAARGLVGKLPACKPKKKQPKRKPATRHVSLPLIEPSFMFGLSGDELLALRDDYRSRHVHPNYTKIFLDGVPGARTGAFHDAYIDDAAHPHGYRGEVLVSYPELVKYVDKSEKLGMGLKIHCAGDYAVTEMLDAVEAVRHFNGPTKVLHHIAHASYVLPSDIARFASLNVVADLCPMIWYPTTFLEGHKEAMGEERATRFWPIADLHKTGALLAGGSDWPVIPIPDPLNGIEGMVTRQNPSGAFPGVSLWPEQAIDVATAIRIFTLNSAIAMGLGEETGSIEPGKSADIIVLDQNLFEIEAKRIAATKVLTTYFEGRAVYQR